jgi:alkylation response protein AidB-like acyl-CoA dehydrogenase
MFHMMNEARIGVGTGRGDAWPGRLLRQSLDYAKNRPAGPAGGKPLVQARMPPSRRSASSNTPTSSACCWRKRAIAKALWRWSCTARAWWTSSTLVTPGAADEARLLLEVLTPIAKSWPSEWCLEANSLAIQIHGGYGYTRDFPGGAVLARQPPEHDPRRHARHPGHRPAGPQGADGRRPWPATAGRAHQRHDRASAIQRPNLAAHANALGKALQQVGAATKPPGPPGMPHRRTGQCRALHAGLWPHGAGLDLAGRGAGVAREGGGAGRGCAHRAPGGRALFLPL